MNAFPELLPGPNGSLQSGYQLHVFVIAAGAPQNPLLCKDGHPPPLLRPGVVPVPNLIFGRYFEIGVST